MQRQVILSGLCNFATLELLSEVETASREENALK
jgi:hypothetical protein